MSNVIKWVSLTELASRSGFSYSTFKRLYLWQLPEPTIVRGSQKRWSEDTVIDILDKIKTGEIEGKLEQKQSVM